MAARMAIRDRLLELETPYSETLDLLLHLKGHYSIFHRPYWDEHDRQHHLWRLFWTSDELVEEKKVRRPPFSVGLADLKRSQLPRCAFCGRKADMSIPPAWVWFCMQ